MHLCIYASYATVYKLVYISYTGLCIYATMHPMQPYINLYIFLIQVYASMHPMQMIKLVFNSNGLISCLVSQKLLEIEGFLHKLFKDINFSKRHGCTSYFLF